MPQYSDDVFVMEFELLMEEAFPLESYPVYETGKGMRETIWSAVLNFLKKIKETMKKALQACKDKMRRKEEDKKSRETIHKMRKLIQKQKNAGKLKVEFYNVWDYQKIVDKSIKELDQVVNRFLRQYENVGSGLTKTNHFIDRVNGIIAKYDKQLGQIRQTKKEYPVDDVLNWMDKEVLSGNDRIFSFLDVYMKKLDEYQKVILEFDEKANAYADAHGMVRRPTELTEALKNISIYVKRNMDWIGPSMKTAGFIALRGAFKYLSVEAETDAITGGVDVGDSLQGYAVSRKIAAQNISQRKATSKAAKRFGIAAGASDIGAIRNTGKTSIGVYNAAKERRNSV